MGEIQNKIKDASKKDAFWSFCQVLKVNINFMYLFKLKKLNSKLNNVLQKTVMFFMLRKFLAEKKLKKYKFEI